MSKTVSVQIPDHVPVQVLQQLKHQHLSVVRHSGLMYIASRGGARITVKTDHFSHPMATYNKNGNRIDTSS